MQEFCASTASQALHRLAAADGHQQTTVMLCACPTISSVIGVLVSLYQLTMQNSCTRRQEHLYCCAMHMPLLHDTVCFGRHAAQSGIASHSSSNFCLALLIDQPDCQITRSCAFQVSLVISWAAQYFLVKTISTLQHSLSDCRYCRNL